MAKPNQLNVDSEGLPPDILMDMQAAALAAQQIALNMGPVLVSGSDDMGKHYILAVDSQGKKQKIKEIDPPVQYPAGTSFQIK